MRQSTKKLIVSISCLLIGVFFAWNLAASSLPISGILILTLALFFLSGHYYGVARGWWEIELRQDWRNTGQLRDRDFIGLLFFFGLGMKPDEVEKGGWKPPRKDNM